MIRPRTLMEPQEEILRPKRSRIAFPIEELKGLELYKKLPTLSVEELRSFSTKKWVLLLSNLSNALSSKPRNIPRNIEEVFCHVMKACGTQSAIEEQVNQFFDAIKQSGIFDPWSPVSRRVFQLSEILEAQKSFIAVRIGELGLIYSRLGLMQAAIEQEDEVFALLLDRKWDLKRTKDDDLFLMVVSRLKKNSILLFLKKCSLEVPPKVLFSVLDNADLNEQDKIDLIEILVQKGASTLETNRQQFDLITVALRLKLTKVAVYLLDKPLDIKNVQNFYQIAFMQDDLEFFIELVKRFKRNLHLPSRPTPETAQTYLDRLKVITYLGSTGFLWFDEELKPYPSLLLKIDTSDDSIALLKEVEVKFKIDNYILKKVSIDPLIMTFRDNPAAIQLGQLIPFKYINPSFIHYALAKRVAHVWGVKLQVEMPHEGKVVDGEGFDQYYSILSFASFFKTRFNVANDLDQFVMEAFSNLLCYGDSDAILINALSKINQAPILLTSGYDEHFTSVIFYRNWLVFCDRTKTGGFSIYEIDEFDLSIVNLELIDKILQDSVHEKDSATEDFLKSQLKLKLLYSKKMKNMNGGFCTQGGTSAAFQALLTLGSKTDDNSWEEANQEIIAYYKKVKSAYRSLVAEELLLAAKLSYEQGETDTEGEYFYKLLLAIFLKMSAHPDKLALFSPESENLKAHLIERLNAISETVP